MNSVQTFGSMSERMVDVQEQPQEQTQPAITPTTTINDTPVTNTEIASPQNDSTQPNESTPPANETLNEVQNEDQSSFDIDLEIPQQQEPVTAPALQNTFDWKQEIKKIDKKELLKELGVDDFAIELNEHTKNGGSPLDYLSARAIDYNKIPDDVLLKEDLQKLYPTLSPSQIDLMFKRKYTPDDNASEEDIEFFGAQKQADAYKSRQTRIAEQQKFKIAETPAAIAINEEYEKLKQEDAAYETQIEQLKNYFLTHEATKNLTESKRVTVKLGDNVPPFNFQINRPEVITNMLTDDGTIWNKIISTPSGEPDVQKRQLLGLVALNPEKVFQDIFNYGVSMGKKKFVEEGYNAQRPQAKVVPVGSNEAPTYKVGKFGDRSR